MLAIPALYFGLGAFGQQFEIESTFDLVERADRVSQGWAIGGSAQQLQGFDTLYAMIAFVPRGAFSALFRPLPGEVLNPFGMLAGLENALVLFILLRAMRSGRWRRIGEPILAWATCTLLVWACIYGFISYQNLGSAFRFKAQVMPILLLLCLALQEIPISALVALVFGRG
jgi:hypothetical protein